MFSDERWWHIWHQTGKPSSQSRHNIIYLNVRHSHQAESSSFQRHELRSQVNHFWVGDQKGEKRSAAGGKMPPGEIWDANKIWDLAKITAQMYSNSFKNSDCMTEWSKRHRVLVWHLLKWLNLPPVLAFCYHPCVNGSVSTRVLNHL